MNERFEALHRRAEQAYDPDRTKEECFACCLSCYEPFILRWRRNQRRHGCLAERENWTSQKRVKKTGKRIYTDEAWEKIKAKQREAYRNARKKDMRHPCPMCGVVMTINRFACSQCQQKYDGYDIDFLTAIDAGYSRKVSRSFC